MINCNEEEILKAKIVWELGLFYQTISQAMNVEKKFLRKMERAASVNKWHPFLSPWIKESFRPSSLTM